MSIKRKRFNEFPEGSGSLSNDDIFLFMDDPHNGGTTKKISLSQIGSAIGGGGSIPSNLVYTTGDQFISGDKYFIGNTIFGSGSTAAITIAGNGPAISIINDDGNLRFDLFGEEQLSFSSGVAQMDDKTIYCKDVIINNIPVSVSGHSHPDMVINGGSF